MAHRINRAIELLAQDQAIYYDGAHTGHVLTYAQGSEDAGTWADYMNVGMEHGSFDMTGLAEYMRGMVDGGPTRSGHRTPAVIVEAPVNGTDEANVRFNAWQFRQILGRGAHGILLCQAETADAVRAFVESCRYPHHAAGVDPAIPSPVQRMHGTTRPAHGGGGLLGIGTRGRGSESTAAAIWGVSQQEYMRRCDPWPLNPEGELLLGVKLESPEGIANCEAICAVPGSALPRWDRAISGCRSATRRCSATPIRRRWPRRARACSRHAVATASRSWRLLSVQHRGAAGRRCAGDRRPRSGDRAHRPRTSEASDACLKTYTSPASGRGRRAAPGEGVASPPTACSCSSGYIAIWRTRWPATCAVT